LAIGNWPTLTWIPLLKVQYANDYCTDNGWNKHPNKEPNSPHIRSLHISFSAIKKYPDCTKNTKKYRQHS